MMDPALFVYVMLDGRGEGDDTRLVRMWGWYRLG